jgi:hypothetical protein
MMATPLVDHILGQLDELRSRCPELRFGQLIATVAMLAEDETGYPLWDVEDADFTAALQRFNADLTRREPIAAKAGAAPDRGSKTAPPETTSV